MRSMTITEMKKANGGCVYVCTKCGELTYSKYTMTKHYQASHLSDTVTALQFDIIHRNGISVSWTIK